MPSLRLYVWGPAFGLPSLDAECLAAIAYLSQNLKSGNYELVESSPSAVPPNHLPALFNIKSDTWVSGYQSIIDHLHNGSHVIPPPSTPGATAHTTFLTAQAAPLLALLLYVSSANYSAAVRPALSAVLPFPLGWTEGPSRRALMARRADHIGLSDLDTDRDADPDAAPDGTSKSFIPARLQPRRAATVSSALTPEARAKFRLNAAATSVLDVVATADVRSSDPTPLACLAFGYLALMVVPDLPRPFLAEVISQKYPALQAFVADARADWFPRDRRLPWSEDASLAGTSVVDVSSRLAAACVATLPGGVGSAWSEWRRGRRLGKKSIGEGVQHADLLVTMCAGALGASVVAAMGMLGKETLGRGLGAPMMRWERMGVLGLACGMGRMRG